MQRAASLQGHHSYPSAQVAQYESVAPLFTPGVATHSGLPPPPLLLLLDDVVVVVVVAGGAEQMQGSPTTTPAETTSVGSPPRHGHMPRGSAEHVAEQSASVAPAVTPPAEARQPLLLVVVVVVVVVVAAVVVVVVVLLLGALLVVIVLVLLVLEVEPENGWTWMSAQFRNSSPQPGTFVGAGKTTEAPFAGQVPQKTPHQALLVQPSAFM